MKELNYEKKILWMIFYAKNNKNPTKLLDIFLTWGAKTGKNIYDSKHDWGTPFKS